METNEILNWDIKDLFEKKFTFEKENDWILSSHFSNEDTLWHINSLNDLKQVLNDTKSLLNDKGEDWHEHTAKINKASYVIRHIKKVIQPEILTQAWCKFYEIVSSFNLIPANELCVRSLHLCEAPGGFISALNYYLCLKHSSIDWDWMASTLNPYYEGHSIRNVIVDDRLLFPTLKHWNFGKDNTGDITDPSCIQDLCNTVEGDGLFHLITADGSVDCLDNPGEQELVVEKIHFAELLIALTCLAPRGCFVIKKFTFFECSTICQLYLLNCAFEKVHVFKPFTSRPSNSEVYVICIGFQRSESLTDILQQCKDIYNKKNSVAIFPQSSIPESFIRQLKNCMEFFANLQIKAIKENLMLYPLQDDLILEKLNEVKEYCADEFIQKYSVRRSAFYNCHKLFTSKKKVITSFSDKTHKNQKIFYFQAVGDTFNNIMKSSSMQWYDKLLDVEKRINICFPASRKRSLEQIEWNFPWKQIRDRMKRKNFPNWITFGKMVTFVHNSKFCNPSLLHLWNRISLDTQVDAESHIKTEHCWNSEILESILKEEEIEQNIVPVSVSQKYIENDPLLMYLKQDLNFKVNCCLNMDADSEIDMSLKNKTVYINSTIWVNTLHNECIIKESLTEAIFHALKSLTKGDTLFLCIQSVLTRYVAGLLFLIISLFDKFATILPEDSAPASMGQIWIFKKYQECESANNAAKHLKLIKELNSSEENKVLEIVPITLLCDGPFHIYLRELNNKHLLQRLRSLIAVEKFKVENSA